MLLPRLVFVRVIVLGAVTVSCAWPIRSQAAAETATATAAASSVGTKSDTKAGSKAEAKPKPAATHPGKPGTPKAAPYLPLRPDDSEVEESNRRNLEAKAGSDAALLILRSVPTSGQVWIDGKVIGETPLLLTLPPRTYSVEIRGPRMAVGRGKVDLLPKEKREFVLHLEQRYPAEIHLK